MCERNASAEILRAFNDSRNDGRRADICEFSDAETT